jgi:hypothetical protein
MYVVSIVNDNVCGCFRDVLAQKVLFLQVHNNALLVAKSNSNRLVYELGIHPILAKQGKIASNRLVKQLGINGNLPSLCAEGAYMRAVMFCHRDFHLVFLAPPPHFPRARRVPARLVFSRGPRASFSPAAGLPIVPRRFLFVQQAAR